MLNKIKVLEALEMQYQKKEMITGVRSVFKKF